MDRRRNTSSHPCIVLREEISIPFSYLEGVLHLASVCASFILAHMYIVQTVLERTHHNYILSRKGQSPTAAIHRVHGRAGSLDLPDCGKGGFQCMLRSWRNIAVSPGRPACRRKRRLYRDRSMLHKWIGARGRKESKWTVSKCTPATVTLLRPYFPARYT